MIAGIATLLLFPSLFASVMSLRQAGVRDPWSMLRLPAFAGALGRSFSASGSVALLSLLIAWPAGVLVGLQSPKLPRSWSILLPLPLALPPFVWAIGLSYLQPLLPYAKQTWLDGFPGAVLALTAQVLPITILFTYAATRQLSGSPVETALLLGGRLLALRMALRHTLPAAMAAALLGGLLVFTDAGCDQMMGYHGFSSEIQIAFSARHDLSLAAIKATIGVLFLLPVGAFAAVLLSRHLNIADLARPATRRVVSVKLIPTSMFWLIAVGLPCVFVLPPICGLLRPLLGGERAGNSLANALTILRECAAISARYSITAATVSLLFGTLLAAIATRARTNSRWLIIVAVTVLAIPAALQSLGVIWLGSLAPPAFDWLLRSEWTVGGTLGLRLAPLVAVALFTSWARLPTAAHEAASLHGVPPLRYFITVIFPSIAPTLYSALIVAALLALADVGSTMLLQPPGGASYPSHLFAVMDNASEMLVASLTLIYLLGVAACLLVAITVPMSITRIRKLAYRRNDLPSLESGTLP